jgi:hypothetical protein
VFNDLVITDPLRRAELAARVWRQTDVPKARATRRCWTWRGAVTSSCEPRLQLDSTRGTTVRRVVWVLYMADADGRLPSDRVVRAVCGSRLCVRPDHLELVRGAKRTLAAVA